MLRFILVLLPVLACAGCIKYDGGEHINGAVSVAAGAAPADASTVNGAVELANDAVAKQVSTVNGSITLGDRAAADSAETVNGAVTIGADARVGGNVSTVNGAVTLRRGAAVKGDVQNVNGQITLDAAHVGGSIETAVGDITVGADSRVDGGVAIRRSQGFSISFSDSVPVVIIGPGAIVNGPLAFERDVKLYVSDRATTGAITGATPIPFPGEKPPT